MHEPAIESCAVSLRELLREAKFFGADDILVRACSSDSRHVAKGDLFVALLGSHRDGHDFVCEAAFRGAAGILAERYLPTDGLPLCVVPDTRAAYGRLCQSLAGHPSQQLKVIAVTGTAGKSTSVELIASVLRAAGERVATLGNVAWCDGTSHEVVSGKPTAPRISEWLRQAVANAATYAVLETPSDALSRSELSGVKLDLAAVTNVRRDHLEYHTTLANYRASKARIFDYLAESRPAVLNLDDTVCGELARSMGRPALTFGMVNNADVTAVVVERLASEQTFLLSAGSDTIAIRTRIIGDSHVYNCLAAAAVGLLYDISLATIARGLEAVQTMPGRMERLECGQPFSVFVDSARTADGISNTLETLREVISGRIICVFGAQGERQKESRPLIGQAVEAHADLAVITDDNPRSEDSGQIVADVLRGFDSLENVIVMHDRAKAICWALGQAQPGDCVLIAGKGNEQFQDLSESREWFDDRELACFWLYDQAACGGFRGERRLAG
jgi:UDP-N-acetylmuramoyl-L-alanyl-D-glutamate--2,6-diaminopimelate ligase